MEKRVRERKEEMEKERRIEESERKRVEVIIKDKNKRIGN